MWKKIFYGFYEVSASGVVRRAKPGKGTWIGRRLHPWGAGRASKGYVYLFRGQCPGTAFRVEDLMRRAYGR